MTDTLHTYLPQDRQRTLARGETLPEATTGSALFADISGFTPLFESLAEKLGPQRAAEEMTRLLGQVYESLIGQVDQQHGSVIDFVGDAITCWFDEQDLTGFQKPGRSVLCAATCALAMQREMAAFADVEVIPGVAAGLAVKIGLACGPARRFVVGDPIIRQMDTLAGETLRHMSQAEGLAKKGEIVLAQSAVAALQGNAFISETRLHPESGAEFVILQDLRLPESAFNWHSEIGNLQPEIIRPWLLSLLYKRLRAGNRETLPELRPVVALFLRFSGIDYDHDPDAGQKLDSFIRWVQQTTTRHDGHLIQLTIGDKGSFLYVVFGALAAHDDDAVRAVRAAQKLLRMPDGLRFITPQIGIASGPARTGSYGSSTRRSYGAIGSDVVLAARLMAAAPPGEMLCSHSIYRQARNKLDFTSLLPVRVKGRARLIRVYRPMTHHQLLKSRKLSDMVGRQRELAQLKTSLDALQSGQSSVLMIEGEAGIGKSRLADRAKYLARERGLTWLVGNGQSIEQQTPYRAWRDVFTAYFDLEAFSDLSERRAQVQALVQQFAPDETARMPVLNDVLGLDIPENELTQSLDAKLRQQNVSTLLIALLRSWAVEHPLVLILEDAHWLDDLSWQLALQVVRSLTLANAPFLLVIVLRPLDEGHSGNKALAELRAMTISKTLALTALGTDEISALIANRLKVPPAIVPAALVELVQARANGNPFFAEELLFNLRDTGIIKVHSSVSFGTIPSHITLAGDLETAQHSLPDTLHELILARIDRLPPERQFVLKVAAVLGHAFAYVPLFYTLNRFTTISEQALKEHLAALQNADFTFLEDVEPEMIYLFKHIITREAAYQTLLFAQRRDLHRAAAEWYEASPEAQSFWPLLAYHYRYAEDVEKECHYLNLAGQAAEKAYANDAALGFYTRLLALITPQQQTATLLRRGKIYELVGRYPLAEADYRAALELAGPDVGQRMEAQFALGKLHRLRSEFDSALEWLAQVKEGRTALSDRVGLAQVSIETGVVFWRKGEPTQARQQLNEGLTLARETNDQASAAQALNYLGLVMYDLGDYPAARAHYQESLALRRERGDQQCVSNSLNNLGNVAWSQGDYTAARALYGESLALYREIGDQRGIANSLNNQGLVAWIQGDYPAARVLHEECLALNREMGDTSTIATALNNLGMVAHYEGDYPNARALYAESLALRRELGNKSSIAGSLNNLGEVAWAQDEFAEARALFEESLSLYREVGDKWGLAAALDNLGNVARAQSDFAVARSLYEECLALCRELDDKSKMAYALLGLGLVGLAQHDPEARQHILESLRLRQEMGEPVQMTSSLVGVAGLALRDGNAHRAAQLLGVVASALKVHHAAMRPEMRDFYAQTLAALHETLDDVAFHLAWAEGEKMTLEQAFQQAIKP